MDAVCRWAAYDGSEPLDIWGEQEDADDCCKHFGLAPAVEVAVLPWAEYEALAVLAQLPCIGRGVVCTDCPQAETCPVAKRVK